MEIESLKLVWECLYPILIIAGVAVLFYAAIKILEND